MMGDMCSPPAALLPSNIFKEICSSPKPQCLPEPEWNSYLGLCAYVEGDRHKTCPAQLVGNCAIEMKIKLDNMY